MKTNYELVREAIETKKHILAEYKGYYREICPHAIGTKKGAEKVIGYQFAGASSKGQIQENSPENWRCLFVNELENIELREGEWITAENHSRPNTCIDELDIEVKP